MKQAYLIIAHADFQTLQLLIDTLDCIENDFFIHFDKKIEVLPKLNSKFSKIFILNERLDVRWGDITLIKVELALLEMAIEKSISENPYSYFHIISGNHLPLYSKSYIYTFFEKFGKTQIQKMETNEDEINLKFRSYNFFVRGFMHKNPNIKKLIQFFWKIPLIIQKRTKLFREKKYPYFSKGSQWISLNPESAKYLNMRKEEILINFKFSFCSDEFFIPTELENSNLKNEIFYNDYLLKCTFEGATTKFYNSSHQEELLNSHCLFGRKFSDEAIDFNRSLMEIISNRQR